MNELMNDDYGHCGECHEVHLTSKMVEIDGYLYCQDCAAADNAALRAEKAKLRELLKQTHGELQRIAATGQKVDQGLLIEARRALESSNE